MNLHFSQITTLNYTKPSLKLSMPYVYFVGKQMMKSHTWLNTGLTNLTDDFLLTCGCE